MSEQTCEHGYIETHWVGYVPKDNIPFGSMTRCNGVPFGSMTWCNGPRAAPLTITLSREDAYALTDACTAYLGGTDGVKHRMPLAELRDKLDEAQGGESL
jgi:hypothetical protein